MIGVAFGDDTARGYQSDGSMGDVLDSGVGSNTVEVRHGELGDELFASQFLQQHVDSAGGTSLGVEEVLPDAVGHITFLSGSTDLLTFSQLQGEGSHLLDSISHASSAVFGGDDVNGVFEHVCAGVLNVHTGQDRDAQLFFDSVSDGAASDA